MESSDPKSSAALEDHLFGTEGSELILGDAYQLVARIPTASVDLAYLDPPWFPDDRSLAKTETDKAMRAHLLRLARVIEQLMRCLRDTGTIFVHSIPELNVHLRLLMDQICGRENFRHEYVLPHQIRGSRRPSHETVFFYSVGESFVFNQVFRPLTPDESKTWSATDDRGPYRLTALTSPAARTSLAFEWRGQVPPANHSWRFPRDRLDQLDEAGLIVFSAAGGPPRMKRHLADHPGMEVGSVWSDINLSIKSYEAGGIEAQKPVSLLERILTIGSHPDGLVLDPYCGSGTTFVAAHVLKRRWIGGDNSVAAIEATVTRLHDDCGLSQPVDFRLFDEAELMACANEVPISPRAVVTGFDDFPSQPHPTYTFGESVKVDESRYTEFKEIKGGNPVSVIVNAADEYAVAFLNSKGGRVLWGIRDDDGKIVGVRLRQQERDRLRRDVTSKLNSIQPQIDPTLFGFELHAISEPDTDGSGLYVAELVVPAGETTDPYYTGGNEMFVRLDGVKKRLTGPQLTAWIRQRPEIFGRKRKPK